MEYATETQVRFISKLLRRDYFNTLDYALEECGLKKDIPLENFSKEEASILIDFLSLRSGLPSEKEYLNAKEEEEMIGGEVRSARRLNVSDGVLQAISDRHEKAKADLLELELKLMKELLEARTLRKGMEKDD